MSEEKIKTGIPGLDELLGGGIPKGRSVLLSGRCGTGKTVFGVQYLIEGIKIGEPGVLVTLEQNNEELSSDMLAMVFLRTRVLPLESVMVSVEIASNELTFSTS